MPYRVVRYDRDKETGLAPSELIEVHPLGKSPVVTDGSRTIAESGAIIEYVLEHHGAGRLQPARGTPEFERFRYWLHFAEGSFMPLMVMSLVFNRVETAGMPFFARPIAKGIAAKVRQSYLNPNIERALDYMDKTLADSTWFAGDRMTAADIQMSFPVEAAAVRAGLAGRYANLQRFLDTIHARPAFTAALEKGGPYSFAA